MAKKIISFDPADFEPVRRIALSFPGADDSVSHYDTPSIKVAGKLMCRLHETEGFVALRLDPQHRDYYLDAFPEVFLLPEHYRAYPFICFWPRMAGQKLLSEVLALSWASLATEKLKKNRVQPAPETSQQEPGGG